MNKTRPFHLLVLSLCLWLSACATREQVLQETQLLMGTTVQVKLEAMDRRTGRVALRKAYTTMRRLAEDMYHGNPKSTVSRINQQAGIAPVEVDGHLFRVLQMAQAMSQRSDGAFDVTIGALEAWGFNGNSNSLPRGKTLRRQARLVDYRQLTLDQKKQTAFLQRTGMRLDLGGIAKLYILDQGLNRLKQSGVRRAMVNGGGDVLCFGPKNKPWVIGVRHPREQGQLLAKLKLDNGFVVSSGDYERAFSKNGRRYHHIIDPDTGKPSRGPQQVTLIGRTLEQVNGLGPAIMIKGHSWGKKIVRLTPGLDAIIVSNSGQVWRSDNMRSYHAEGPVSSQ